MTDRVLKFVTPLSTAQCVAQFQESISQSQGLASKMGGVAARIKGGSGLEFYAPTDPLDFGVPDTDPCTAAIGALVPRALNGARGNCTNVQMQVWERGDSREVVVVASAGFTGVAHISKILGQFETDFGPHVSGPIHS